MANDDLRRWRSLLDDVSYLSAGRRDYGHRRLPHAAGSQGEVSALFGCFDTCGGRAVGTVMQQHEVTAVLYLVDANVDPATDPEV